MSIAVPAYVAVLILSGGIYFLAVRAMHRPVQIGVEVFLSRTGGRRACSAVSDLDLSGANLAVFAGSDNRRDRRMHRDDEVFRSA